MTRKHSTVTIVPEKMPAELGQELLARIGPQQIAALQVGQQIGRRGSGRRP